MPANPAVGDGRRRARDHCSATRCARGRVPGEGLGKGVQPAGGVEQVRPARADVGVLAARRVQPPGPLGDPRPATVVRSCAYPAAFFSASRSRSRAPARPRPRARAGRSRNRRVRGGSRRRLRCASRPRAGRRPARRRPARRAGPAGRRARARPRARRSAASARRRGRLLRAPVRIPLVGRGDLAGVAARGRRMLGRPADRAGRAGAQAAPASSAAIPSSRRCRMSSSSCRAR